MKRAWATRGAKRLTLIPLVLIALAASMSSPSAGQDVARATDWREQYAYTLGMQAYIFGFPYVYLPFLRWDWVTQPKPPGVVTPYAPLNQFYNARRLANANYRQGGAPNNDTLYSIAWLDLRSEPLILSHPDMGDRYFVFELASLDSDNFAYVGKRATGSAAGSFAIVGPNWKGTLPDGVKLLPPSRTSSALIFGRTLVEGPADVAAVNALQDQYTLIPLSLWGNNAAQLPASRDVWRPFDPKTDRLADWKTMSRAMTEDPPEARLATLVELLGRIGVGPDQDPEKLDEASQRGLIRAAADARKLLEEVIASGFVGRRVNGWNVPPKDMGRAGLVDDFLLRASLQCLAGIIANDPAEAVYMNTAKDSRDRMLDGGKRYTMHFAAGQLPEVKAFWSITMYDASHNLTPNSIDRYAIGDRTPGLKRDPDGGLTLHFQRDAPGVDEESNWLPTPASGPFLLVLRTYLPGPEIADQRWSPPPVVESPR